MVFNQINKHFGTRIGFGVGQFHMFDLIEKKLNGRDKFEQRFALTELSKLMAKMIPQEIGGLGEEPIEVTWKSKSNTIRADGLKLSTNLSNGG
jgi:hypothetical protein